MFTQYDPDKNEYSMVEEPDPSLEYSYADYLKWKFEERVELIRGRIMKMTAPNRKHQEVAGELFTQFKNYLKGKSCKVYVAPFDVRLPKRAETNDTNIYTVVQPDICVVCDEQKLDDKGCMGAPDLVVEILSPGNSKKEIRIKHELYEEAGVKEYWIVNPVEENAAVFILNKDGKYDGARLYGSGDMIPSVAVPGFAVNTNDIFST
ncbi:Uma2 family endonuclease [Lacibacter sp. MH-610]|uniref:Uma2 family endonuclease n=1 Tax=Lacibacter sp. MH-610 TaxID=3020883 RepID=UPI00389149D5